jgi:hypothetical protein
VKKLADKAKKHNLNIGRCSVSLPPVGGGSAMGSATDRKFVANVEVLLPCCPVARFGVRPWRHH